MTAEMTERRQLILKLVIQDYVESSEPVGSEQLRARYQLGFSAATIRNELAMLEELGYLTHTHTSAGRLPTDAGYRYYVENLMDRAALSPREQHTIRHQFHQVRSEFDQWIQLAGTVLARTAQNASVVTPPRAFQSRFKHLELIPIHDTTILLVLVLHDGTIRQQTLTLDQGRPAEELSRLAAWMTDRCADAPISRVEDIALAARMVPSVFGDLEALVFELVLRAMRQHEERNAQAVYSNGLMEILNQPEFTDVERVRRVVGLLQDSSGLTPLFSQVHTSNGVQVVIGGEHTQATMRDYSVVLARYGFDGEVAGVLGIIGPTRMPYKRTISAVRYVATVMSDLLLDMYGDRTQASQSIGDEPEATGAA